MPLDETSTPATPAAAATPWPAIDLGLIDDGRPAPIPFPLPLLPERWRAWVEATAQAFTPVDFVAQSLLAAVSAVCGGGIVARVTPQWAEPLVLWQALVGGPSSGKSPALAAGRRLLDLPEDETADDDRSQRAPTAVMIEEALHPLAGALRNSPQGVTLWGGDVARWMAEVRPRDRASWLAGWSGEDVVAHETGHWPISVRHFPLSIVGTLRPVALADVVGRGDEGLAARFLYAWPEPTWRGLGDRAADDESLRRFLGRITDLAGRAAAPGTLPFEAEAVALLDRLLPGLGRLSGEGDGVEAGWIGKGAGTIVRLAGLLQLMRWAEDPAAEVPDGVGRHQLDDAYALWAGYFRPHAERVFGRGGTHRDRRAIRWLRRAGLATVSREDIRRQALCQTVDADGAEAVIARLETGGVLRRLAAVQNGGRPRRRWEVNPALR